MYVQEQWEYSDSVLLLSCCILGRAELPAPCLVAGAPAVPRRGGGGGTQLEWWFILPSFTFPLGFFSLPIIACLWPFCFVTYLKVIYSQSCAIILGVIPPLSKCASTVNYWRLFQLCVDVMDIYYILTTWQNKYSLWTINIIGQKIRKIFFRRQNK